MGWTVGHGRAEAKIETEILAQRTMRYRRNLLAVAAAIVALGLFPEIDWATSTPFGIKFTGNARASAGLIAWGVAAFYAINFALYGYHNTRAWVGKVTPGSMYPELRMLPRAKTLCPLYARYGRWDAGTGVQGVSPELAPQIR